MAPREKSESASPKSCPPTVADGRSPDSSNTNTSLNGFSLHFSLNLRQLHLQYNSRNMKISTHGISEAVKVQSPRIPQPPTLQELSIYNIHLTERAGRFVSDFSAHPPHWSFQLYDVYESRVLSIACPCSPAGTSWLQELVLLHCFPDGMYASSWMKTRSTRDL